MSGAHQHRVMPRAKAPCTYPYSLYTDVRRASHASQTAKDKMKATLPTFTSQPRCTTAGTKSVSNSVMPTPESGFITVSYQSRRTTKPLCVSLLNGDERFTVLCPRPAPKG